MTLNNSLLTGIFFLFTLGSSAQRVSINLSGQWQSSLGACVLPGTTDENKLGDGKHDTGNTSQLTRLYPYTGVVSYERRFVLTKEMEDKVLTLEVERTKPSTLWIDGDSIGSICQLFAPHVYVLPETLKAGTHHIRLDIDNRDSSVPNGVHGSHAWSEATQTNWNGMLGRIEIVGRPHTYIEKMKLYPDVDAKVVRVRLNICAERRGRYDIALKCSIDGQDDNRAICVSDRRELAKGRNEIDVTVCMGDNPKLWSEFHPDLYTMEAEVSGRRSSDKMSKTFGMRSFAVEGTQFAVNGNKTFLRGTHDACVFPLTAYCPTDVESWLRLFAIAKQYGINHYRFHSYTPTEAAFIAADQMGIYIHTELPMWGVIDTTTARLNDFLRNEAFTLLDLLGDHPSFVSLGLGNELWGDTDMMSRWIEDFRRFDPRHLYSQGSNNDLGWKGPKTGGEDFYITCRVGGGEGFSTHVRTSFSFADAEGGGILNACRPSTRQDFSHAVSLCASPVVSHETCQFQIYPDYKELPKYTGVLYPYNLEAFRKRIVENGMAEQIEAFHDATGRWAVECYKADMEYCLRTPGFGGYQLLDIKDYPGQGTALCGILDAFMDSKGIVRAEDFKGWNSPVVPMALMDTYCWSTSDTLRVTVKLCNYTEDTHSAPVLWSLDDAGGDFHRSGEINNVGVKNGEVNDLGDIVIPLADIRRSSRLRLNLSTGQYRNCYNLWVYDMHPSAPVADRRGDAAYLMSDTLDARTLSALRQGRRVLLTPRLSSIEKQSVGGLFTPDYWNYSMFKTISENNHKPVSPGTLGLLMDPSHPVFDHFPTDGRTDWQWWCVALGSRPLVLDDACRDCKPIIQVVDNVERNHKLGILMEFKVGRGSLLICTTSLDSIARYVEGKAYISALQAYIQSKDFCPEEEITEDVLRRLLYSEAKTRDIKGVKNITDYNH